MSGNDFYPCPYCDKVGYLESPPCGCEARQIESQVMSELADKALTTRGIIRRVCELAGLKVKKDVD